MCISCVQEVLNLHAKSDNTAELLDLPLCPENVYLTIACICFFSYTIRYKCNYYMEKENLF